MYFLNSESADYTLTPQTARAKGYTWICDLPRIPKTLQELESILLLVHKHGYTLGTAKFDDNDLSNYAQTGLYKPRKKRERR